MYDAGCSFFEDTEKAFRNLLTIIVESLLLQCRTQDTFEARSRKIVTSCVWLNKSALKYNGESSYCIILRLFRTPILLLSPTYPVHRNMASLSVSALPVQSFKPPSLMEMVSRLASMHAVKRYKYIQVLASYLLISNHRFRFSAW